MVGSRGDRAPAGRAGLDAENAGLAPELEDLEQCVGLMCRLMGRRALENIHCIGPRLQEVVEALIQR